MVLTGLTRFSKKKLAAGVGFYASLIIGSAILSTIMAPLLAALGTDVLVSLLGTAVSLTGSFLGAGTYLQALKEFKVWPMGNGTPSFRPRNMLNDVISALKSFDWGLLKYFGGIYLDNVSPETREALVQEVPRPEASFWARMQVGAANMMRNAANWGTNEYFAPWALRDETCARIHEIAHKLTHGHDQNQAQALLEARRNYLGSAFMTSLRQANPGMAETCVRAVHHEVEEFISPTPRPTTR